MEIRIKFFAGAADAAGRRQESRQVEPGTRIEELLASLGEEYPGLRPLLPNLMVSVNQEYVARSRELQAGDEVALIPPVSGGAGTEPDVPLCEVTDKPLEIDPVLKKVLNRDAGAVLIFLGTVRETTGDKTTTALEYDAYPEMAVKKMEEIAAECRERWPGCRVAMTHRTGHLEVGEVSVVIATSAPHRGQCYEASRHAIEQLKKVVPIWKKEIWADGETLWVGHS